MIRKASAIWQGTGKEGSGHLTTDSGVLSSTPYSFKTRFENEKGTNPEELIAAAHAGCFTMALAFQLQAAGFEATELSTEAAVSLVPVEGGFKIEKSALTLRATLPGGPCAGQEAAPSPASTRPSSTNWRPMRKRAAQFPRC